MSEKTNGTGKFTVDKVVNINEGRAEVHITTSKGIKAVYETARKPFFKETSLGIGDASQNTHITSNNK